MPDDAKTECSICLEELDGALVVEVACGNRHRFHETCFRRHSAPGTRRPVTCPLCRNAIHEILVESPLVGEEEREGEGERDRPCTPSWCGVVWIRGKERLVAELAFLLATLGVGVYVLSRL